jgi:hypothetical protein
MMKKYDGTSWAMTDRNVPGHDIWVSLIYMLYNDEAHLDPPVQGAETVLSCAEFALGDMTVEVNRPRLFRDGVALHMVIEKTRSLFTNIHENSTTSDRLDTSAQSFLGELVRFLPILSGGGEREVTEESRRVALIWFFYQVGTPQGMTELVNISPRASPNDVGIEDSVSGEPKKYGSES